MWGKSLFNGANLFLHKPSRINHHDIELVLEIQSPKPLHLRKYLVYTSIPQYYQDNSILPPRYPSASSPPRHFVLIETCMEVWKPPAEAPVYPFLPVVYL